MLQDNQMGALWNTFSKFRRAKALFPSVNGLPQGELMLLNHLQRAMSHNQEEGREPGVKISRLGKHLHMSMPAISQMLSILEDKGLIQRSASKGDRRIVNITLTPEGERINQEAEEKITEVMDAVVEEFGKENIEELVRLFDQLFEAIETVRQRREESGTTDATN